jgi:uncharacterized protein
MQPFHVEVVADSCVIATPTDESMKLHLQTGRTILVTGAGPGWIRINADEYHGNMVLTPDAVIADFAPGGFDALVESDFSQLLAHRPEIVLLGTGSMQRFPPPQLTRALTEARVGVEVMDTPAVCRTFNILTGEERRVVAALLLP